MFAHHQSEEGGEEDHLTNFLTGGQRGGAPNLFTPNSRVHHHGGAGRVVPSNLDGDTWGGRQVKDLVGAVKREDLVLIGGIWGWWRSRMRAQ